MYLNKRQIAQSTYQNNSVGRLFKRGSFWDKLFKGATAIVSVFIPPIGAAMATLDTITPDRTPPPSGGDMPGRGGSGGRGVDFYSQPNVAGIPKQNKNYNTPKVF